MTTIRTPALGILNDVEAPHQNMVVLVFGKPGNLRWCYVAPRVLGNGEHQYQAPDGFTPLSDFGVHATLTPDGRLALHQLTISVAKYPDGKPRRWQGDASSIIDITEHAMRGVMLAVRNDFRARRESQEARAAS